MMFLEYHKQQLNSSKPSTQLYYEVCFMRVTYITNIQQCAKVPDIPATGLMGFCFYYYQVTIMYGIVF